MKFKLEMTCDNAAFESADDADETPTFRGLEISRILEDLAHRLEADPETTEGKLHDANGNRVGEWSLG
jgi:hypothetical protein